MIIGIMYFLGFLVSWPAIAVLMINDVCDGDEPEPEDILAGTAVGLLGAIIWPVSIVFAVMYFCIRNVYTTITRDREEISR